MTEKITADSKLITIMDLDPKIFDILIKFGLDTCCGKMETLKDSCIEKNVSVDMVVNVINEAIDEMNYIEKLEDEVKEEEN